MLVKPLMAPEMPHIGLSSAEKVPGGGVIPLAYLNTEYPSLSHTFIESEIRALRERGLQITTFSVRKPGKHATIGSQHAAAAAETVCLLDGTAGLAAATVRAAIGSPLRALRTLVSSQKLAPPGMKSRLRHAAYAVEGIRLALEMRARSLCHVHVHMANNGAAVAMLAHAFDARITYSLSIHGSAEFFHVDSWTLREKVEGATFVRCISNFCRAQVMAWCSEPHWRKLQVVHCGVDTLRFSPVNRQRNGPLRLLAVGRLHPIKAYPLLLQACRKLTDAEFDWTLTLVGDGPSRASLESIAAELGISERVRFAGAISQDEIQLYFARADVLVMSSFMEGVPVVLMEAMATGLPIVSTNVGGIPELVSPTCGVLTPPGSAEGLAAAVLELAHRAVEWPEMAIASRARIEREYDIRQTAGGMHQLFISNIPASGR